MDRDKQHSDELDEYQLSVLESAVEKLVLFGKLVGVTPEEMIRLLDSGLSMDDLISYLASRIPWPSMCRPTGFHRRSN
jgi:hypothetical protein